MLHDYTRTKVQKDLRPEHGSQMGVYLISQDLETMCPKLVIVKFLGFLFFKGDHNVLLLQP